MKFAVSDTFSAHRGVGHISCTQYRQNASCENLRHVYVGNISCTFPDISCTFPDVAYTSKIYHVYNIKYTQTEASIPALYNVYKVYK